MPELPELEVVREVLAQRLPGARIARLEFTPRGALVARDLSGRGFEEGLCGAVFQAVQRRGKYLVFTLAHSPLRLAVNPKLSGRLQLCPPGAKRPAPLMVTFHLQPLMELRYLDRKRMGQLYLTADLAHVPGFAQQGLEPLEVDLETFRARLRGFRGEIKGVLTRGAWVAGIGNAYADEILWQARIHPYRKVTALSPDQVEVLYHAMRQTLEQAIAEVRRAMGEQVHLKPRHFFAVHMRGGEACPRCGAQISTIQANQRITNFCRTCQPGGLLRGMR